MCVKCRRSPRPRKCANLAPSFPVMNSNGKTGRRANLQALKRKLSTLKKTRLARQCSKLSKNSEQNLAEEGIAADLAEWPKYFTSNIDYHGKEHSSWRDGIDCR